MSSAPWKLVATVGTAAALAGCLPGGGNVDGPSPSVSRCELPDQPASTDTGPSFRLLADATVRSCNDDGSNHDVDVFRITRDSRRGVEDTVTIDCRQLGGVGATWEAYRRTGEGISVLASGRCDRFDATGAVIPFDDLDGVRITHGPLSSVVEVSFDLETGVIIIER